MRNRVAVTGMGVMTPVGTSVQAMWDSIANGRSGIGVLDHFDTSNYPTRICGRVNDFDPANYFDAKEARHMARFQQFALAAAEEAMRDADLLGMPEEEKLRAGCIVGSGIGGMEVFEEQEARLVAHGPRRVSPFTVPMLIVDLAAGQISIRYGLKGINFATVSACATGSHAIGEAAEVIRRGSADIMLAGGFDASITPFAVAGFSSAKALSTRNDEPERASRPWDLGRDGFVMSEGGGLLVLEEWDHAVARGARIHAELVGYGATGDAYHVTAPNPEGEGAARAMIAAIQDAGLTPADIDYINAHGTSTDAGDYAETLAVKAAFGADAPPVSSTKSMMGHLLGGAGAVEAAACILAMQNSLIPPTINLDEPDPRCDLDYVPNIARAADLRFTMSNSFGFGGHNATLLFARA